MSVRRRWRPIRLAILLCCAVATGCRETEPPRAYERDLGTDDLVLLPVTAPLKDAELKDGRADWHPFRKPGAEEPAAEEGAEESGEDGASALASEIRALLENYNEVVAEATADDLLEFYTADQHEALKPVLEAGLGVQRKLGDLAAALGEKLPDSAERIEGATRALAARAAMVLLVETVSAESENAATGVLPAGGIAPTCRFRRIEGEWYIELNALESIGSAIEGLTQSCDGWLLSLKSEQGDAEAVLEAMERPRQAPAAETEEDAAEPKEPATPEKADDPEESDEPDDE